MSMIVKQDDNAYTIDIPDDGEKYTLIYERKCWKVFTDESAMNEEARFYDYHIKNGKLAALNNAFIYIMACEGQCAKELEAEVVVICKELDTQGG